MSSTALGIDVGGTKLLGVVIDDAGRVLHEEKIPTKHGIESLLEEICVLTSSLQKASIDGGHGESDSLGLGIPGPVNNKGIVIFTPNLPGVENVNFSELLTPRLNGTFVYTENDANVAGWGERTHGAGQQRPDVVMVTLGTGIGGGIVINGQLLRGYFGLAAEVGHMVVDPNGIECPCGKRGCWERYASGTALGRLARIEVSANSESLMMEIADNDLEKITGEVCIAAAQQGDALAAKVFDDYANWVALGLANLSNILDPDVFIISGGLAKAGEFILGPIKTAYDTVAFHAPTEIVIAALGEQAGAIGAADLARHMAARRA